MATPPSPRYPRLTESEGHEVVWLEHLAVLVEEMLGAELVMVLPVFGVQEAMGQVEHHLRT